MTTDPLLRTGSISAVEDEELRQLWLSAVHESLRTINGRQIGDVAKPTVGQNYYQVDVQIEQVDQTVRAAFRLNAAVRLVALVAYESGDGVRAAGFGARPFLPVPTPDLFRTYGFTVAGVAELERDLTPADLVDLTPDERRDVSYHEPPRVGDALFNWFD